MAKTTSDSGGGCINIILQSYEERDTARNAELEISLKMNLDNPYVKFVYDLTDKPRAIFGANAKYKVVPENKWLTYQRAFDFANTIPGEYFAIINSDITLDSSSKWDMAVKIFLDNRYVLAQSRHEYDIKSGESIMDPGFVPMFHAHTQDAWLFKSPIAIPNCNFEIGLLGCDNAIAHRINSAGYNIINKPQQFKILHHDSARGKTSANYMQKHSEKPAKIINQHPEEEGYYLLPNYDVISHMSLDDMAKLLGFNPTDRYKLICSMMTQKIKIKNR